MGRASRWTQYNCKGPKNEREAGESEEEYEAMSQGIWAAFRSA